MQTDIHRNGKKKRRSGIPVRDRILIAAGDLFHKHGIRGVSVEAESNGDQLAQIGRLIDEKKIKVVVSQTFPLADAANAQTKADTGHARGKIVLKARDEAN